MIKYEYMDQAELAEIIQSQDSEIDRLKKELQRKNKYISKLSRELGLPEQGAPALSEGEDSE